MLQEETKNILFKIVDAVNNLADIGILSDLFKIAKTFGNYEFVISCIIKKTSQIEKTIDYPIDFIEGVKEFTIPIKSYVQEPEKSIEITISKIDKNKFTNFPYDFNKSRKGLLLKENYKKYCEQKEKLKYEDAFSIIEKTFGVLSEQKKEEMLARLIEDSSSKKDEHIARQIDKTNLIELDPSKFYFLNELVADLFTGGIWWETIQRVWEKIEIDDLSNESLDRFALPESLLTLSNIPSKSFGLHIDAILHYGDKQLKESIIDLKFPFWSKINYKLRGYNDGIYCPLSKYEYISGLSNSLPVKEILRKLVDCIDTLPSTEKKKDTVKQVLKKFEEKGLYVKEKNGELKQIKDAISLMYSEIIESTKKQEDSSIQINKMLSTLLNYQNIPKFVNFLSNDYKQRYKNIYLKIMMLRLPIAKEKPADYIDIINLLGTFASQVLKDVLHVDVTISSLEKNYKAKEALKKLQEDENNCLLNYSGEFGKLYNNVRHNPNKVKKIYFDRTKKFIDDSHKILDIVLKNRELFN